jgi:hypothetical protein
MNLSCKRASELLSEEQDRDLSFAEWTALKVHLVLCHGCRTLGEQFKTLRRALRLLSEDRN